MYCISRIQLSLKSAISDCIPNLPGFPPSFAKSIPKQFLSKHLESDSKWQYGLWQTSGWEKIMHVNAWRIGKLERRQRNVVCKCHILMPLKWHKIKQFLPPNFSSYIRNLNVLNESSLVWGESWALCWSWCTSRAENQWILLLTVKVQEKLSLEIKHRVSWA